MVVLLLGLTAAIPAQKPQYQQPKEEDQQLTTKTVYTFNPLQAEKEFKVGEFYYRKQAWRGAVGRYQAAVKWNPGYAKAFWKLGLAEQKLAAEESRQPEQRQMLEAARQAFEKYLKLSPRGKKAKKARKQLARLGRPESPPSVAPSTRPR